MNSHLISIIVPCYNQAQHLDECLLQSAVEQTYQNWECIIVNDGSPQHKEGFLSLPINLLMEEDQVKKVINVLNNF